MADSYWQGTANGSTTVFSVPFPYLQPADVIVQVNGVPMLSPGDYVWLTAGSIQFKVAPPNGNTVTIARSTSPDSVDVSFSNGAVLTAADLNTAVLQCFYRTQELQDQLNTYIGAGVARYSVTGSNPLVTPNDLIAAAADAVLQTSLAATLLGGLSDIATNASDILSQTTRVDTLQATLDTLTSGVPGGIGTYLTNETNSRIAGDEALQSTLDIMGALNLTGDAFILNTGNVYVDSTTTLANRLSLVDTTMAGNTAAIATEATARAAGDAANASSITSLTTTVGGNTASIASQLTSINGLEAQYTVRLDVNGHIAGFGLASGAGGTSDFTVVADRFSIIDTSLGSPVVPFIVTSGVVYMQNVVIGSAVIDNLAVTTSKIANSAVTEVYSVDSAVGSACSSLDAKLDATWAAAPSLPYHNDLTTSFTPASSGECILTVMGISHVRCNGSPGQAPTTAMWLVVVRTDTGAVVYQNPISGAHTSGAAFTYDYNSASNTTGPWVTMSQRGIFTCSAGVPYRVYVVDAVAPSVDGSNYVSSALVGSTLTVEIIKK